MDSEVVAQWDLQDPHEADLEAEGGEEDEVILQILIPWLVTSEGYVAIWPMTVPKLEQHHREVAMQALPRKKFLNPGIKAQKLEAEVGLFDSRASTFYMTRPGMSTQWTMQVNCTSPSDMNVLRPKRRLRRKNPKKQKTEKDLCQCGYCKHHTVFN